MSRLRIPVSTYRLQLHKDFGFKQSAAIVPYLAELGITDFYSSPSLMASPGSSHGYDICDHTRLNPELGTDEDYNQFVETLAAHGMGQLLDFVPNHMGANPGANPWWRDVLENGPSSPYARFFDIEWDPIKPELKNKVLLPILGDQYGRVLERGELPLHYRDGAFSVVYYEYDLPINPRQATFVLKENLESLQSEMGDDPDLREFLSILTALQNLPPYTENDPARIEERQREKEVARERLARLADKSATLRHHIDTNVRLLNGEPGRAESFNRLHALLEGQAYRLAYWRTAFHEINYRRFFDINMLVALRMEDDAVFEATHAMLLRLIREGKITGLRLDHVDGLYDPVTYLRKLQSAAAGMDGSDKAVPYLSPPQRTPNAMPFYVVVEKILSLGESLPEQWPVQGTSGYDFLNDLNGVFVDARNALPLKKTYTRYTGRGAPFAIIVYASKSLIMKTGMASELSVLAHALNRLSEQNRHSRDFTLESLRDALREVVACFPVYRTYLNTEGWNESDREKIDTAIARASRRNPAMERSIFDFVRNVLLPPDFSTDPALRSSGNQGPTLPARLDFAMKFQQYTGPVQAKGLEDTSFYRYNALLSFNEVGGDPQRFGRSLDEFHNANRFRLEHRPYAMLSTSTHDTKRGEDVRARINVLSELPREWRQHFSQWIRWNASHRTMVEGEFSPDRNDEYLFYQTLLGVWPTSESAREGPPGSPASVPDGLLDRLCGYMLKAIREAKLHTSWINENKAYQDAVVHYIQRTLTGPRSQGFFKTFLPFQQRVAFHGMINSLAQVVLKLASPGVPDFYQGTELWDLNLADPDNRRPVDFAGRSRRLEAMKVHLDGKSAPEKRVQFVADLRARWREGDIKMYLTASGLRHRREKKSVFLSGTYEPLPAFGPRAENIISFGRRHAGEGVIVAAPRLTSRLAGADPPTWDTGAWEDTRVELPIDWSGGTFRDLLTGEERFPRLQGGTRGFDLKELFQHIPVAILQWMM